MIGRAIVAALALTVGGALLPLTAAPPRVSVTDGDTLRLDGAPVRLWGIDAPERRQTCASAPGSPPVRAGELARAHLAQIIAGHDVACSAFGRDRYGRTVSGCRADGEDIAAAMVADGWALDWPHYSAGAYASQEADARRHRRGLWAFACVAPWSWRHSRHGGN